MNVALINPRSRNPHELQQKCFAPVNLLYLAAALIENGHRTEIIEANAFGLTDSEVVQCIRTASPGLIGVPLISDICHATHALISRIKDSFPGIPIVTGGPHASALPEQVLEEFKADYVLRGESEKSIVDLVRHLEGHASVTSVKGLYYRDNGKIAHNPPSEPVREPDALAMPARDLLKSVYDAKKYHMILVRERPVETVITSRGCPHRCRFCCNTTDRYRPRSPENVMEEIVARRAAGIRNFDLADANFTLEHERAMKILDLIIREKLGISFRFKSRTHSITPELVKQAKKAGAYLISVGMESGSQAILDRMQKGTRIERNIEACRTVMDAGVQLNTGWIIGFPGETPETVDETVNLIVKIKPTTANIGRLIPYPGTNVYAEAKANGTLVGDWSVRKDQKPPWIRLPWINSLKEFEGITQKVIRKVYFRPHYLFQFAGQVVMNLNIPLFRYAVQEMIRVVTAAPK